MAVLEVVHEGVHPGCEHHARVLVLCVGLVDGGLRLGAHPLHVPLVLLLDGFHPHAVHPVKQRNLQPKQQAL